jgi:hypothetical protein
MKAILDQGKALLAESLLALRNLMEKLNIDHLFHNILLD